MNLDPVSREVFWRRVALVALALCVVLTADRLLRGYLFSAREPRPVTVRAELVGDESRTADVFRATAPSVVAIHTVRGSRRIDAEGGGAGSGFVWDRAGHIVTNDHVIEGATEILAGLDDGRVIPAVLVGHATWADLAVVRLTAVPDDLKPIPIGNSRNLVVGQGVLAIGNPFGLSQTLTTGVCRPPPVGS